MQSSDVFRAIPFRIGDERFAVHISDVQDFIEAERIRLGKDPHTGSVGVLQRRGGVSIPVFPLGEKLGLGGAGSLGKVVIVMKAAGSHQAYAVDEVDQPIEVRPSHYFPVAPVADPSGAGAVEGVIVHEGKLLLRIDPERIQGEVRRAEETITVPQRTLPEEGQTGLRAGSIFVFLLAAVTPGGRDILFAVSGKQVLEIVEESAAVPFPAAPRFVPGLALWRNRPLPVIDLSTILGWEPLPQEKRNLLVARAAGEAGTAALSISGTARTIMLPIQHRLMGEEEVEVIEPRLRAISTAVFDIRGRVVALLDIDYLLGAMTRKQ
ncbi:MAG: chemotaxis protein CheW [Bryobacterales bacterium]|nr:chemotaxis protein CheW [Bryobacterales bacterium]